MVIVFLCLSFNVNSLAAGISAKSAIVINGHTGEVIYEKNAYERLPMASTTKIMTALLLAEQEDLSKQICCTKEMVTVEGSSMGLLVGDLVTYNDLLYGMLLASGNDAANTTAIALGGSVENFVSLMNQKARLLELNDTNFATPSGLDADGHYTTAYDLAKLASVALKNEKFKKASSSSVVRLCYGNPPYNRTLTNHNKLLKSYSGLVGVKTGFTKKAGRCLVTAAERDGAQIIAVTLNDGNDWQDHKFLLDYGFSKLDNLNLNFQDIGTISVVGSSKESVKLKADNFRFYLLPENASALKYQPNLPTFLFAPIKKGEVVGTIDVIFKNNLIQSVNVVADEDAEMYSPIEKSVILKVFENFIKIITNV